MRYGAIPENALEERMLRVAGGPRVALDALVAPIQTKCFMLATRLGVFDQLAEAPRTTVELARTLDANTQVLTLVMRMLRAAGYVSYENGRYALTEISRHDVLATSSTTRRAYAMMCELFWDAIGDLDVVLRSGRGIDSHSRFADDSAWRIYQASMLETARVFAPLLVPYIPVRTGARSLLDLAGSHGFFGAAICRAHPPMQSEVIELPQALEHARALAREAGVTDVVTHRAGDILATDLGTGHDVILLNNVLHHLPAEQAQHVIARAASTLAHEGTVAILEFEPSDEDSPADALRDATALFFGALSAGRCHGSDTYRRWLEESGLGEIRVHRSRVLGHQAVVVGRAP